MTNEETFNSLTKAQWVDQACDRFEMAWRAGQPVSIESIVEASPESVREALVNELVAIEIELRRKQGESPSAEEFVGRFPGIDPNVADLAAAVASNHPSSSPISLPSTRQDLLAAECETI